MRRIIIRLNHVWRTFQSMNEIVYCSESFRFLFFGFYERNGKKTENPFDFPEKVPRHANLREDEEITEIQ